MDAKQKIWEAVLIYDPDRLARRYSYQELIMDELKEAGIEVIFVTTPAPKDYQDKILHGVKGLFAEYERARISERFRLGKLRKVREGHLLVSEALYGYDYIRGDKENRVHGRYEINDKEAEVVRNIFSWVGKDGFTIRAVVRKLQELGIKPRKSKREVWATSTLTTMLRNKAYIGEAHWGSSYAVVPEKPIKIEKYKKMKKTSRKIKPENEWIASKIPVPKIIEPGLFMQVREQLKSNLTFSARCTKNEYLLAGKIRCSCGRTRGGEGAQHGKHLYYRCNDRNYSFPLPPTCAEKGMNARIADKIVWDEVSGLMSSSKLITDQINRYADKRKNKTESTIGDTRVIEREVTKLKGQEERYNRAYGAGVFSLEQLREYSIPLRDQITLLESQITKARLQQFEVGIPAMPNQKEILEYTRIATEKLKDLNFQTKRGIIMNVLDKIIATQAYLEGNGFLPITANYVDFQTIYRNRRSAKRRKKHPI
jgi:site-specific DNA recombinase